MTRVRSIGGLICLTVILILSVVLTLPADKAFAQDPVAEILSPRTGESIRGAVTILGTASAPNFQRYKVEYASQQTDTVNWFLIGEVTQQVTNGPLAQWDTSTVDDGLYQIRLRLIQRDGAVVQTVVTGLIVQNNVPTPLPVATLSTAETATLEAVPTEVATLTPVVVQPPTEAIPATETPTELPPPTLISSSSDPTESTANVASGSLLTASLNACLSGVQLTVIGFVIYGAYSFGASQIRKIRDGARE